MDSQHRGQRLRKPAAFPAAFWVAGLDKLEKCLPGHYDFHLRQELLPLGLFLGGGLLAIRAAELLATHQPSLGLRS